MPLECYTLCLEEDCSLIWKKINTGVKSLLYVYMLSHEYILLLFVAEWKEVKKNNCGFHLPGISTSGMADKVIQSNYNIKNNYEKWKNKLKISAWKHCELTRWWRIWVKIWMKKEI